MKLLIKDIRRFQTIHSGVLYTPSIGQTVTDSISIEKFMKQMA